MPREKSIVIAFGRFNPPTTGHERLVTFLKRTASRMGADARIYASPTTDAKKNPLPFQEKVGFLRQLFPQVTFNSNAAVNTPFAAYADASAAGYKNITVIVGADRVRDFEKFGAYLLPAGSSKYNAAKHIDVSQYRVLGIPRGAGAMSATLMRGYVVANDFPSFLAGTPGRNAVVAKKVFTSLRKHMRIREQKAYREAMIQKVSEAPVDKRHRPPLQGHPYHKKTDAQLRYIVKDAGEAAKAMRGHATPDAEHKYLDQFNDAVTVLYYRKRGGAQVEQVGLGITKRITEGDNPYAPGTRVKISGSGVAKRGKVVRYDKGDRHGSPFYVIDVGRARSEKIGAHNVQKEDVEHIEKDGVITFKEHLLNEVAEDWLDEAVTKLDEGSKWEQMRHAIIIFKSLAPRNVKVPETAIASDIVDQAVYYFLSAVSLGDTAELRRVGQLLHKATQLGIKWNQKLIKPHIRNRMSLKAQGVLLNQKTKANEAVGNAPPKVGDRVRAGVGASPYTGWSKAGFTGTVERIEGKWIYVNLGPEPGSKWGDRIIKAPRKYIMREAGISAPKPPSEVDRMKVRQTTDLITLKQRQATELMAAKIRDVETKAREAQTKATAPKGAAGSAS